MRRLTPLIVLVAVLTSRGLAQDATPRLFTSPDVSATQVCFTFAGDIWLAPRNGGTAHRLTSSPGRIRTSPRRQTVTFSR